MEGSSDLITRSVPSVARGLNILLVEHDTMSLMYLASMLEQYSYEVTTTELASVALSMIWEQKDRFKLVMANINLLDMGSRTFLRAVLKHDIPVILMSSKIDVNTAGKALAEGACFFLEKPISLEDLKYVWQHAYRKRKDPMKEIRKAKVNHGKESQGIKIIEAAGNDLHGITNQHRTTDPKEKNKQIEVEVGLVEDNCIREWRSTGNEMLVTTESDAKQGGSSNKRSNGDKEGERKEKQSKTILEQINSKGQDEGSQGKDDNNGSNGRKSRLIWTPELHLKFTLALSALGDKDARPKAILKLMNVPNLTHRHVSSHLQKFKAQVNHIAETSLPSVSKSSNSFVRPECPQPLENGSAACQKRQGPDFRFGGQTMQSNPPNSLIGPDMHAGNFSSHDLRALNHNSIYAGLPRHAVDHLHSYSTNNCIEDHVTTSYGELQRSSLISKTGHISSLTNINGNEKKKWPIGLGGSCVQVPELNLPYLSYVTPDVASPNTSEPFQLPNMPAAMHQGLDLVNPCSSQNHNHFPTAFTGTTQETDFVPRQIPLCNAGYPNNLFTGYSERNEKVDAVVGQAPPVCSINQSQPRTELGDQLKVLEEELNEFNGVCNESIPVGVDQYCEWLAGVLFGNSA